MCCHSGHFWWDAPRWDCAFNWIVHLECKSCSFNYQFCDVGCCCCFLKIVFEYYLSIFWGDGKQTHNLLLAEINKVYSCIKHHCLFLFFSFAFWEILHWYCNLQCDAKSNEWQWKKERRTLEELSPETGPGVGSSVSIWKPRFSYLQVCLISRTLCSGTHACMSVCVCVNFEAIGFTAWAALLTWHQVQGSLKDGNCSL